MPPSRSICAIVHAILSSLYTAVKHIEIMLFINWHVIKLIQSYYGHTLRFLRQGLQPKIGHQASVPIYTARKTNIFLSMIKTPPKKNKHNHNTIKKALKKKKKRKCCLKSINNEHQTSQAHTCIMAPGRSFVQCSPKLLMIRSRELSFHRKYQ